MPNCGDLKLNIDAAVSIGMDHTGVGVIIQEHNGLAVAACSRAVAGSFSTVDTEAIALREDSILASKCGLCLDVAKCDALQLIQCLQLDFNLTQCFYFL